MFASAQGDFEGFVIAFILIGYVAWVAFMATYRTKDFIELVKTDQDRKDRQAARLGGAAKAGFGIARFFMRR